MLEIKVKNAENIDMYASTIHNASQKALNLLSNLMEWALSHTGRLKFVPNEFNINEIVNENALLFSDLAKQKTISITNKTSGSLQVNPD